MPAHCVGKQGTFLRISGGNLTIPREIIEPVGGVVSTLAYVPPANTQVSWEVFVSNWVRASLGTYSKWQSETFVVQNVYSSATKTWSNRLIASPNPTIRATWTTSIPSSITGIVYKAGTLTYPTYSVSVISGSKNLFSASNNSSQYVVTEVECGCNDSDCQIGTFPTDYCCTNCAQQSGILQEIISALQSKTN